MNRAARRAARFTKQGRAELAGDTRNICEHGNWMKTDGNGNPMCPHGCGFKTAEPQEPKLREFLRQQTANIDTVDYRGRGA